MPPHSSKKITFICLVAKNMACLDEFAVWPLVVDVVNIVPEFD